MPFQRGRQLAGTFFCVQKRSQLKMITLNHEIASENRISFLESLLKEMTDAVVAEEKVSLYLRQEVSRLEYTVSSLEWEISEYQRALYVKEGL
jgi:uncharacterized protein (DUF1499 family)